MPISIPDDRAVSGVGLKPTLEFGLLRSEVLTARGYPEVDGDGPEVHPAIMYDFIGRSNRALWGSQKPQKNQDTAQSFQRTLQVGHCLIASGPAALSVGFCTVTIVTPYKEGFGFDFWGGVSPPLPVVSLLFSVSYPEP